MRRISVPTEEDAYYDQGTPVRFNTTTSQVERLDPNVVTTMQANIGNHVAAAGRQLQPPRDSQRRLVRTLRQPRRAASAATFDLNEFAHAVFRTQTGRERMPINLWLARWAAANGVRLVTRTQALVNASNTLANALPPGTPESDIANMLFGRHTSPTAAKGCAKASCCGPPARSPRPPSPAPNRAP